MRQSIYIFFLCLLVLLPGKVFSEVVYSLDFSKMSEGSAGKWLKENDFVYKLDADELEYKFKNGNLVISNKGDLNGLLYKEIDVKNVKRVRIEWGVTTYASGVDWSNKLYRDTIMLVITFGQKKIDSGSFYIPNLPYFIGIFLDQNEVEGKAYTGNYYKQGGRYFCSPCRAPEGKLLVTDFELQERFKDLYGKSTLPPVSAIVIETDTRDLKGSSEAYIKKIEFLSD